MWHHGDSKLITQQQSRSYREDKGLAFVCFRCSLNQKKPREEKDLTWKGVNCWEGRDRAEWGASKRSSQDFVKNVPLFCAANVSFLFYFFFVSLFDSSGRVIFTLHVCVYCILTLCVCVIRLGFCLPATMFVDNDVWLNMNAKCLVAAVQSWNRTLPRPQAEWLVADDGCQPLVVCLRLQASELDLRAACEPCTQLMKSPTLVPAEKPHRCLSSST